MENPFNKLLEKILKHSQKSIKELYAIKRGKLKKITKIEIILENEDAIFYEEMLNIATEIMPHMVSKSVTKAFNRRMAVSGLTTISRFFSKALDNTGKKMKDNNETKCDDPFNFI